jgi:hypothetical protein
VTAESPLLDVPHVRETVAPFDPASLTFPWRHRDARVDSLQSSVMHIVKTTSGCPRAETFSAISRFAREHAGFPAREVHVTARPPVPYVSEPWYCCAEPMESV